ncbi:hypothetical protein D3C81_1531560 [compost metagenome]
MTNRRGPSDWTRSIAKQPKTVTTTPVTWVTGHCMVSAVIGERKSNRAPKTPADGDTTRLIRTHMSENETRYRPNAALIPRR